MSSDSKLPQVYVQDDETFEERKPRYYAPIQNLLVKGTLDYFLRVFVSCSDAFLGRNLVSSKKRYHGGDVHQKRHKSLYGVLSRYDRFCDLYRRPSRRNLDYGLSYRDVDSLRKQFSFAYGKFFPKEILVKSLDFCISRFCADVDFNRDIKVQSSKIYHRSVLKDIDQSRALCENSGLPYSDLKGMTLDQVQKASALKEQMDKGVARKAYWASRKSSSRSSQNKASYKGKSSSYKASKKSSKPSKDLERF